MRMLFWSFLAISTLCLFACTPSNQESKADSVTPSTEAINSEDQAQSINPTYLQGYFVKNDVMLQDSVEFRTFASQEALETVFGIAKTMDNEITQIDFTQNAVAAIITMASHSAHRIEITDVEAQGSKWVIHYEFHIAPEQSFNTQAAVALEIPSDIKIVAFSTAGKTTEVTMP
ncbi:hypothetical protein [Pontibacter sp. G13]|uniref:hypothetical protein n=1 Tax=Pontibacter sp. G13 TaxID=3074898 RepID=UPI00288AD39D|nr:hypothetical protein [Pontibacter sp. G13]WNJ18408.1 hypothetical protein RJD25_26435 [Pontibacter sp. G13]